MDIDKFIKDKGLKVDCIVESDLDVKEYVQYEVRNLIKEAVNKQLRLCIVSQQRELLRSYNKFVNEECLLAGGILTDYEIKKFKERNCG